MKKIKIFANILFWLTLISPLISFALASIVGESAIFGVSGIVRYSFVMWLFIPFGIISILLGKKLKDSGEKYKANYIIAFICIPLLLIFGSYRFIFNGVTYDDSRIEALEEATALELPENVKVANMDFESYSVSYLKITDSDEQNAFETAIKDNALWTSSLSSKIKNTLPFDIQVELDSFDSFVFYNSSSGEYNIYPLAGEYSCIFVAYDRELQRLIVIKDYPIIIS